MAFIKFASVGIESVIKTQQDFETRTASRRIVEYDPEFVYVTVRALTANRPNNNGDAFPHEELVRIDALLNRPVYASFIGKGVYVNHQHTDDPLYAKGVVLDARYVTAKEEDRHVELLLGVDRKKDPVFASSIERGLINKFSMGASVQFTRCSICNNEARAREEFCDHIAKGKMREFEGKVAYENCFGVIYNEISAVSDPADETAQLLQKIAKNTKKAKSGIVVSSKDTTVHKELQRLETAIMAKMTKKVAQPEFGAPDMGVDAAPEFESDAPMGDEGPKSETAEVLRVVTDLVDEKIAPEEAVAAITNIVGPGGDEMAPPGAELGGPEPAMEDFGPAAASANFSQFVKKLAKEYAEGRKAMNDKKSASGEGGKVDNQYPYKKENPTPTQHHTKPHKGRPSSDFAKDKKDYAKQFHYTAIFQPNTDKKATVWVVSNVKEDGTETPVFRVSGSRAFGDLIESEFVRFSSHEYGEALMEAIMEDGLDSTMARVNAEAVVATPVEAKPAQTPTASYDADKLIKAAEKKAADLAEELTEDWKIRLVEGLKVAIKAQGKNLVDNPLKASAFDVLTANGLDGALAEKIVDDEVVAMHMDALVKEAQQYAEMQPEAFEEIKAKIASMPKISVVENKQSSEDRLAQMGDEAIKELRRRAGMNIVASTNAGNGSWEKSGDTVSRAVLGTDSQNDRIAKAVNINTRSAVPTKPLTYGKASARV